MTYKILFLTLPVELNVRTLQFTLRVRGNITFVTTKYYLYNSCILAFMLYFNMIQQSIYP